MIMSWTTAKFRLIILLSVKLEIVFGSDARPLVSCAVLVEPIWPANKWLDELEHQNEKLLTCDSTHVVFRVTSLTPLLRQLRWSHGGSISSWLSLRTNVCTEWLPPISKMNSKFQLSLKLVNVCDQSRYHHWLSVTRRFPPSVTGNFRLLHLVTIYSSCCPVTDRQGGYIVYCLFFVCFFVCLYGYGFLRRG